MRKEEYDTLYPKGSAVRQEYERINGPWCGHQQCAGFEECVAADDPRERNIHNRVDPNLLNKRRTEGIT
jgi:hypothetical protein